MGPIALSSLPRTRSASTTRWGTYERERHTRLRGVQQPVQQDAWGTGRGVPNEVAPRQGGPVSEVARLHEPRRGPPPQPRRPGLRHAGLLARRGGNGPIQTDGPGPALPRHVQDTVPSDLQSRVEVRDLGRTDVAGRPAGGCSNRTTNAGLPRGNEQPGKLCG